MAGTAELKLVLVLKPFTENINFIVNFEHISRLYLVFLLLL